MAKTIKARIVAGEKVENYGGHTAAKFYESGVRRARRKMCDGCKHGHHSLCESEACPCVCNDSDFRWSRRDAKRGEVRRAETPRFTSDPELAQVLAVRPELRPLFEMR